MEKIASFTVNHLTLMPGVYVSRQDNVNGNVITTFDIRITRPNKEPVINTAELHAIEHLGATYLRNDATWKDKVIYFGPMGCRTGFYLILAGDLKPVDIIDLLKAMFKWMADYEGDIPGQSARDCGNYLDLNLPMAKFVSEKYYREVLSNITEDRMIYPE
ncbi:MAG: S-ribosylhomocysteine lyase [Lachnospiraceae bacterium]|nr:S-ribosylhomocysteine lyase [Lachnospiraceae bacterium]MBR0434941.1 S-ribosylhomocysteine lyase [Lachnospiraceae bacterium]